ncbi:phosphoglycerate kinase [Theileria orientalis]|uniref:Phosphoglycerate kinase n=1 Tax=Theileria orientalis TaxID=68886 RepID=A0A976M4L6_THEOR|nr:phosphoglycerate kinase [Theileria orientalis]
MESLHFSKLGLKDIADKIPGKRVLMRVDYNVPLRQGKVTDLTRVKATIPSINFLLENKAKSVVLMSHCGRPDGETVDKYSLRPVVAPLMELLGREVKFLNDCVGEAVVKECQDPPEGSIFLLENLRFHGEEEGLKRGFKIDNRMIEKFRRSLSKLGDIYVNDAFGTAHRAHSSMVGIDMKLRVAGFLMKRELEYFAKVMENPERPFLAILGGAKVKDKVKLIMSLLEKVDVLIIAGAMAYTFKYVLKGMSVGNSLFDKDSTHLVKEICDMAVEKNVKLVMPVDFLVTTKFSNDGPVKVVSDEEGVPHGWMSLDCGDKSIDLFREHVLSAKTIVWNGPLGVFEFSNFANGCKRMLDLVIEATKNGATSIIGGGDTASLAESSGKADQFSHVSTGGGASLELLEGKVLPGVAFLSDKT